MEWVFLFTNMAIRKKKIKNIDIIQMLFLYKKKSNRMFLARLDCLLQILKVYFDKLSVVVFNSNLV